MHASDIPSVSAVLQSDALRPQLARHPRQVVVDAVRALLARHRAGTIEASADDAGATPRERIVSAIGRALPSEIARIESIPLRRVINVTGVVVHTNLGRSPLAPRAIEAVVECARGYSNLEFDLEAGARSTRSVHVEPRLLELTGAECAHVVNNNAAALMLCLAGLARGREVVVSRGELVEIGGSFRVPDIMAESGAQLVEVGTTNRTRLSDYRAAVNERTALLLKVHRSNFTISGFTGDVPTSDLSALGRELGVPVLEDLGSGAFHPFAEDGIPGTPTVREALAAGADIVTVSGDKLLGGPQAGIIAGRAALVAPLKKHPLSRALRVDKLCLAALSATLALYADPLDAARRVPTVRMMTEPLSVVRQRAALLVRRIRSASKRSPSGVVPVLDVVPSFASPGGGAMPGVEIPSACVSVTLPGVSPDLLDRRLRTGSLPVVARIAGGALLLDLRTVSDDEVPLLAEALVRALSTGG
jgi:L-seryl-tRNA(Ser) seleniumtransferase